MGDFNTTASRLYFVDNGKGGKHVHLSKHALRRFWNAAQEAVLEKSAEDKSDAAEMRRAIDHVIHDHSATAAFLRAWRANDFERLHREFGYTKPQGQP